MTHRELAAFLVLLALVLLLAIPAPLSAEEPAHDSIVPPSAFTAIRSAGVSTPAPALHQPSTPSPSLRAVSSLAASVVPAPPSVDRTAGSTESMTGMASTYGPGFDGYLALPAGPGIHVRICGAGGCIDRVSNDAGPVPSLHRVADLDVADFERVCGLPWTRGLCRVTVEVLR